MLPSLCAKVWGASSSPYRPRTYKWGLIHSSHCRVLYFELSCQKSALLSRPVPLWVTWGTGREPQPTGIVCTFVCGDVLFMAMPTGPQLPRHCQALTENSLVCPLIPSGGTKRGKQCLAVLSVPSSQVRRSPESGWRLQLCACAWARKVCTAPSPVLRGWYGSSLADVLLRRRDANLENSPTYPCCCDHSAVYIIP